MLRQVWFKKFVKANRFKYSVWIKNEKMHLRNTDKKSSGCIKYIRKLINFSNVNYPMFMHFFNLEYSLKAIETRHVASCFQEGSTRPD